MFAVVAQDDSFYYFGGVDGYNRFTQIQRLDSATWTWSIVGNLNQARDGHGVALVQRNTFMVVGGLSSPSQTTKPNEVCTLDNGEMTCEEKTTTLNGYVHYPAVFPVNDNYGTC